MRHGFIILMCFLFALIAEECYTQQLIFKSYAINDGLVHNSVRRISQDSKGFLWIATWEGLSKYDGHRFTNYSATSGMSNDFINDVVETKDGVIYICCNDGGIYSITNNGPPQKLPTTGIVINRLVAVAQNKYLALTDKNGIQEYKDGQLSKPPQYGPAHSYFDLEAFNDSLFIVKSDYSVELLNHRYQFFSHHTESTPVYGEGSLLKDSKNRIWVSTQRGLKLVSPHQEKGKPLQFLELPFPFSHPLLQNQWITCMLEDAEGNFWFGTPQGMIKIGENGLVQLITEKNGLPLNTAACIYQDKEKNIWIGSSRGIARLATTTSIRLFTVEDGLSSNSVVYILPFANGDVLAGSHAGMSLCKNLLYSFKGPQTGFMLPMKKPAQFRCNFYLH
jgi:ligand-binding sensor domain-containing protein